MYCHRFSAARCACDKRVRHLRDVYVVRRTGDVSAECGEQWFRAVGPFRRREKTSESNHRFDCVRHFNADKRFSRDWRFNAHRMCGERELQIIRERHYFRQTHPFRGFDSITRDGRTHRDFVHFQMNAEILESAFYDICVRLNIADSGTPAVGAEYRERRSFVFGVKIRDTGALSSCRVVENIHYRVMLYDGNISSFRFVLFIRVLRHSDNVCKFFCKFLGIFFAGTDTFPE